MLARLPLFLGGVVGGIIASVLAGLGRARPVGEWVKGVPEVEIVYGQGYEIWFHGAPAPRRCQHMTFTARLRGRTAARLDVDWIEAGRRLYVANICTADRHGRRGLGTALVLCAAKTTGCKVLTTSGRTSQGARFFKKIRAALRGNGVELRDGLRKDNGAAP